MKPETLYAYVSRGMLTRHRAEDGRRSLFERAEIERLAARSRRGGRAAGLEVIVDTSITRIDPEGGLYYRGQFDNTPELQKFAETLEKVCVDTVESGFMTKDLALLISPDQKWLTTVQFLDKLDENLKKAMG